MQAFYVKKEKKLPNVYHKSKAGNQIIYLQKIERKWNKILFNSDFKLFFKEHFHKTLTIYQNKGPYSKKQIFFCKTLDIFLKHDKIIVVRADKIAFKQEKFYKEIFANDEYRNCKKVIEALGGRENVNSVAHCATRLRVMVKDEAKINKDAIENLEKVQGAFFNSGQYQIIFGTGTVKQDVRWSRSSWLANII